MSIVTKSGGFVFTRVYFDGDFELGDGRGRAILGQKVQSGDYDPDKGLRLHLTDYEVQVPPSQLSASWKRPS